MCLFWNHILNRSVVRQLPPGSLSLEQFPILFNIYIFLYYNLNLVSILFHGPVFESDMQTSSPPPTSLQKWPNCDFGPICCSMFWNGSFPSWGYSDHPFKKICSDFLVQVVEKRSKTDENRQKKIRFFLVMVDHILSTKITITWKIKIEKILKLTFHSFQHIPHLSCKFEHFSKNKTI